MSKRKSGTPRTPTPFWKTEEGTRKEAGRLLKKWASVYGLFDWDFFISVVPYGSLGVDDCGDGTAARVKFEAGARKAELIITFGVDTAAKAHGDFELIIKHELMHIAIASLGWENIEEIIPKAHRGAVHRFGEQLCDAVSVMPGRAGEMK